MGTFQAVLDSVWTSLVLIAVVDFGYGGTLSFGAWQNELKDLYQFTQTQVELIGSLMLVSTHAAFIGGLLMERYTNRTIGAVAMTTVVSYSCLIWTLYHPEGFSGRLFPLLLLFFILNGIGQSLTYIVSAATYVQNFPENYRGRMFIAIGLGCYAPMSVLSTGVLGLKGIFYSLAIMQFIGSLCCMFFFRRKQPPQGGDSYQLLEPKRDGGVSENDVSADKNIAENVHLRKSSKDNEQVNETTKLNGDRPKNETNELKNETNELKNEENEKDTATGDSLYGEVTGLKMIKFPDFWFLSVAFVFSTAVDKTFGGNVGTYLRSFRHESYVHTLLAITPWFGLASKISCGLFSDFVKDKRKKFVVIIVAYSVKLALMVIFILKGDDFVVICIATLFIMVIFSMYYVFGPLLIAEYFGKKHFGINYGTVFFADSVLMLMTSVLIGVLYDAQIDDVTTYTCYGLHCYYASSSVLFMMSLVTFICIIFLFIRRRMKFSK